MKRRIMKKVWLSGCAGLSNRHNRGTSTLWYRVTNKLEDLSERYHPDDEDVRPKWAPSDKNIDRVSERSWRRARGRKA